MDLSDPGCSLSPALSLALSPPAFDCTSRMGAGSDPSVPSEVVCTSTAAITSLGAVYAAPGVSPTWLASDKLRIWSLL